MFQELEQDPDNNEVWRRFVDRYANTIVGWCIHHGLNRTDADDVAQDVLVRLVKVMKTFKYDRERSFRSFLCTVTRCAWLDFVKSADRKVKAIGDDNSLKRLLEEPARESLVDRIDKKFDVELAEIATANVRASVGPEQWRAFNDCVLGIKSRAEYAETHGISAEAVDQRISRIQRQLMVEVKRLEADGLRKS